MTKAENLQSSRNVRIRVKKSKSFGEKKMTGDNRGRYRNGFPRETLKSRGKWQRLPNSEKKNFQPTALHLASLCEEQRESPVHQHGIVTQEKRR